MEQDLVFITKYVENSPLVYGFDQHGNPVSFNINYSKFIHIQVLVNDTYLFEKALYDFHIMEFIRKIEIRDHLPNLKSKLTLADLEKNSFRGHSYYIYLKESALIYFKPLEYFLKINSEIFSIIEISTNSSISDHILYFIENKCNNKNFKPYSYYNINKKSYHLENVDSGDEQIPFHKVCSLDIELVSDYQKYQISDGFGYKDKIVTISLIIFTSNNNSFDILERICFILIPNSDCKIPTLNNVEIRSFQTERELLEEFCHFMYNQISVSFICGYNIIGFDFPVILNRMIYYGIASKYHTLYQINTALTSNIEQASSFLFGDKFQIIDVFLSIKYFFKDKYESFSLNSISECVLKKQKKDINFQEMNSYYDKELNISMHSNFLEKLCEYCLFDCELCGELYIKLKLENCIIPIMNVTFCDAKEIYRGISYVIGCFFTVEFPANGMLCEFYTQKNSNSNNKRQHYQGATVLSAERKILNYYNRDEKVYVLDFTSLYPNIIREFNLSYGYVFDSEIIPENCKKLFNTYFREIGGWYTMKSEYSSPLSVIIDILLRQREECKVNHKLSLASAYKTVANSIYGLLSLKESTHHLASLITQYGRYIHRKVAEYIREELKLSLIYGDTDSFFIISNRNLPVCDQINSFLTDRLGFKYIKLSEDYIAEIVIFLAEKKKYILRLENGSIVKRGFQRKSFSRYILNQLDLFLEKFMQLIGEYYPASNFLDQYGKFLNKSLTSILENSEPRDFVYICKYKSFQYYISPSSFQTKICFRHANNNTNISLLDGEIKYCIIDSIFKNSIKKNKKDSFEFYENVVKQHLTIDRIDYIRRVFNFLLIIEKHILKFNIFGDLLDTLKEKQPISHELMEKYSNSNQWSLKKNSSRFIFYYEMVFKKMAEFKYLFWENRDLKLKQTLLIIDSDFILRHISGERFFHSKSDNYLEQHRIKKINVLIVTPENVSIKISTNYQLIKFLTNFYDHNKINHSTNHFIEEGILLQFNPDNGNIVITST